MLDIEGERLIEEPCDGGRTVAPERRKIALHAPDNLTKHFLTGPSAERTLARDGFEKDDGERPQIEAR